jgi:hypothetical protein
VLPAQAIKSYGFGCSGGWQSYTPTKVASTIAPPDWSDAKAERAAHPHWWRR